MALQIASLHVWSSPSDHMSDSSKSSTANRHFTLFEDNLFLLLKMAAALAKFELFFSLPPEIRERILQELCIRSDGVFRINGPIRSCSRPLDNSGLSDKDTLNSEESELQAAEDKSLPLGLFLANSQLYQEASAIFYTQNRFSGLCMVRRPDADECFAGRDRGLVTGEASRPARMRIRKLTLTVLKCGGFFMDGILPNVADMVLHGALRELRVDLMAHLPRPHAVLSPPFRALFRLLADPDLEAVLLRSKTNSSSSSSTRDEMWDWERSALDADQSSLDSGLDWDLAEISYVGRLRLSNCQMVTVDLDEVLDAYKDEDDRLRIRRVDDQRFRLWGGSRA
jgi:hypothetical protein